MNRFRAWVSLHGSSSDHFDEHSKNTRNQQAGMRSVTMAHDEYLYLSPQPRNAHFSAGACGASCTCMPLIVLWAYTVHGPLWITCVDVCRLSRDFWHPIFYKASILLSFFLHLGRKCSPFDIFFLGGKTRLSLCRKSRQEKVTSSRERPSNGPFVPLLEISGPSS